MARLGRRVPGACDDRRGGVPPDHVLARGGGAADHRGEHRPRDAALAADGPRDDRAPRARRLREPRRGQVPGLHRRGPRSRAGDRPAPSPDRALPHRRPRDPLGRGPRGGRAARARHVAGARGADAGRDRRRHHLPARAPDRRGRPRTGRAARRRRVGRRRPRAPLRERGRGAPALPEAGRAAARGSTGSSRTPARARWCSSPTTAATWSPRSVAETVSVRAEPAPPARAPLPEALVLSSDRYGR